VLQVSKQPSPKFIWLLTYAGVPISAKILEEYNKADNAQKDIDVDEAYTTKDTAYNYTLIHVTNKVRESNVSRFMASMSAKYNIQKQHITGYESIDGISERDDNGKVIVNGIFKNMLRLYLERSPNFLEPYTTTDIPRSGGLFNIPKLTRTYPELREFISLLTSSGGLNNSDSTHELKKPPSTNETDDGASCSAMVVDAVAQPVSEEIEGLLRELTAKEEEIATKNREISTLNSDIADKRIKIDLLKDNITSKDNEIVTLKSHVASACMEMVQLAQESSPEIAQISRFNQRLYNEVQHLQDEIKVKTKRAEKLDNKRLNTITKLEKDNEQLKDRVFDLEGQVERLPR
jgi:hypothetical protein